MSVFAMPNDLQLPVQNAVDPVLALDAINQRAYGLMDFIGSYRKPEQCTSCPGS
ncbi:hypothetical protein ACO0LD_02750 [Undibacterium sp. Ji83W]|uniref:hypothetical protein n=1 Tax=Undibacterium sp. Ji83W TaxID=3413043 RepID=UPI003BF25D91